MHFKKTFFTFFALMTITLNKAQRPELSEAEINDKYEQIEAQDLKINNLSKFTFLYQYSLKKNYKTGILRGLIAMQKHYLNTGKLTLSQEYGEKGEAIAKELNDYKNLSIINNYLGNVYTILGLQKDAQIALSNAMKYSTKINNQIDRNIRQSYICASYAGYYEGKNLSDSVVYYTRKGLDIIESTSPRNLTPLQKSKYYYMLIFQNMNMGNIYIYTKKNDNLKNAEPYFLKALNFSHTNPIYFNTAATDVYNSVSLFYLLKKDFKKSIYYSEKVLQVEKYNNSPKSKLNAYENLKTSYDSIGNIAQQNKYLKLYIALNDSLSAARKQSIISRTQNEINQNNIKIYGLKNDLIILGIIALVFILITIAFFYRKSKEQKKKYSSLINKLQQNTIIPRKEETISGNTNFNLSQDKEKDIIKKLAIFERSEKFLKKNITLSYLSHHLNINHRYLSQIINKDKGQNFNSYINHLRINYILNKLYNNSLYKEYKISYLAEECGYSSTQVFINAFRKETGMPPSYFISNLKNNS